MRAQPQASHFIDGEYVEDIAGTVFESIYPATGEVIARLHAATPAIVEKAIAAAKRAQPEWAAMSPTARGRILKRAAEIMRERNRELSELETLDTGKPIQETIVADPTSGADSFEFFGGVIATALNGDYIPLGGDFAYTKRVPLGVCVGIGAWNYPQQIACWKGAPALAAGNAMVFKPSENTPLGALKIAEILIEAGLPKGLYNVIQGDRTTGPLLVNHPDVAKVSLTGSVPTGRKVYEAAAAGLRHVTMELGGKSPLIVFDDADLESAIGGAMLGNFYSTGQVCSNGTRVFVQKGIKDAFLDRLKARTEAIVIGDPMDEATQLGPMVSGAQRDKVFSYIEKGKAEGARLVTGGGIPNAVSADGTYIQPTVFADVTDDMTIAREEIFGPVMCVLDFESEADVVARANATEFGLSAGVFTADITRAHRVVDQLEAGTLWINTYNLCPVEIPFGGSKQSGFGRENSVAALNHYSELKTVYVGMSPVQAPY
ncbi:MULTISPECIES: betaine-aldehyde dehydrogenase [Ensifer]|jgi:betaine-aldehyde dehydrogenase|uniref:Betaine aldehyde dehydrogenase n=1 Tax=Ensifer canadensis TaxID=555315 RepID=A0AAW4FLT1_9HYPH|nr:MULTISPECIES: betaine-aldehyde dehydrogenase [Ensifer]AHK43694.1 betaine aldehyde dehydrogenase [Ensifer adhaerens OV14]MDP9628090.1 betaine-aldehyde dehydrogenase [Ensifer adhaerens]KQU72236.1 betaine-aldehyde dehydrogenase [Ensifer sp. Root31]KQW44423.1 betaine-aldehyde dehydrogenase [Ensifer sp. Root1252]KQW84591.1 betaine-aldehyde dehydrogenase [Ensifer sp. Root127]